MSLALRSTSIVSIDESPMRIQTLPALLAARDRSPVSAPSPTPHSDQFEDAPEDLLPQPAHVRLNPLEALALACAAENTKDREVLFAMADISVTPNVTSVSSFSTVGSDAAYTTDPNNFPIALNDVLCGRGGLTNHHPGNIFFRRLVRIKQEAYLLASKRDKAGVAREIVELVRTLVPPGRFLKKDEKGMWVDIGDRKAREKTSQALREGAPELREERQTVDVNTTDESQTPVASDEARAVLEKLRIQNFKQEMGWSEQPAAADPTATKPGQVLNNRARVVSDDAGVLGIRPLFHQIHGQHSPHVVMDEAHHFQSHNTPHHHAQVYYAPHLMQRNLSGHGFADQGAQRPFPPLRPHGKTGRAKAGAKRKVDHACLVQEGCRDIDQVGSKRGPRVKLLKSRLKDCTI